MFARVADSTPDLDGPSAGLSSWDAGEPIPEQIFQRMTAHAAFPAAVRAMADGLLALAASDRAIDGIFKDAGRYIAAACTAMMPSGVTLADLKALCAKFGLLSPGRAGAMLLYLGYLGYVSLWRERSPNGPARYRTSPTFLAAWQAHLRIVLDSAALIEADAAHAAARLDEPAFFESFCRLHVEGLIEGIPYWDPNMAFVRVFLNRHAGTQIGWTLLVQQGDGAFPFSGPLQISKAALARRFGVSLMHIKRLFADARREGLIEQNERHHLFLTKLAQDEIRFLYAAQLIRLLMTSARVFVAMGRSIPDTTSLGTVPPGLETNI